MADRILCPSCGASHPDTAEQCDLCGSALLEAPDASANPERCASCGHLNPEGATFCNHCGDRLTTPAPTSASTPPPTASSAPGRRALYVVGAGLVAVLALYGATLWSESRAGASEPTPPGSSAPTVAPADPIPDGPAPPLPPDLQARADAFEAADTAEGWYEAGRFYLTAAFESRQANPVQSAQWARRAVANFERSLEMEANPDVQLALAEASQFDPSTPMRPVTELQALLATYPDHVGANFMLGERRLLIGRLDSARASFERVLSLTEPGDPLRARAEEALAVVAAQTTG